MCVPFCGLLPGGLDDLERWDDNYYGSDSNRDYIRQLWDAALEDQPDPPSIPRPDPPPPERAQPDRAAARYNDDPWSAEPSSTAFSDEPPF